MTSWKLWMRVMDGPTQLRSELVGEWTSPTHTIDDVRRIAKSTCKRFYIVEVKTEVVEETQQ